MFSFYSDIVLHISAYCMRARCLYFPINKEPNNPGGGGGNEMLLQSKKKEGGDKKKL